MNGHENYEVYRLRKLTNSESLELFSWHAFGQKDPIRSHINISERFVQYCDGIPLALEVLGYSVRSKNIEVSESELKKLEATSNSNTILEKLEMSYGSLNDDHDKNLFLDISCFFVGKKKSETITILKGCDYCVLAGIYNLVDRNLLSIENGHLEMHKLLQDMGKQIVCRESKHPEKRSRIWCHKESSNILIKQIGTEAIEGLVLDMNMLRDSNVDFFQSSTFEKMYNLRLLKLSDVKFSGTCKAFPMSLRWLYWRGFPSESIPNEFPLENLVSLDMRYSNLKQVWKGTKVLGSLKILNLSYSFKLVKTPNFSRFPKLEKLVLKACPSLFEVDESIVGLQQIKLINLSDCKNLRKLPRNIGKLESLEEIDISGCSNLMGAIEELEKMKSLRVLKASRMDTDCWLIVEVASQVSIWPWVPKPRVQMSMVSLPSSLVHLNISDCNLTDDAFPKDLSKLLKLQKLYLGGNPVSRLPNFIQGLTGLQALCLSNCPKLQQIHWSSTNLTVLLVNRCQALQKVTCETGTSITRISYYGCRNVNYVEEYFKIFPVREVDVELLNSIGFFNLDSMADLAANLWIIRMGHILKYPIQIVNDNDASKLIYTFFPGEKVPHWFSNRESGSTISFRATLSPHFAFRGLNLCALYTLLGGCIVSDYKVMITNKRSGKKTGYRTSIHGIPEKGQDMIWLSHCFEDNLFTEGDEVEVSFSLPDAQIKECGVHLLYLEEEGEVYQYLSFIQRLLEPNLSPHEPEPGVEEEKEEPYWQNGGIYSGYNEEWDYTCIRLRAR